LVKKKKRDWCLSRNQFTKLPESIGELKSLEILSLSGNNLRELPDSLILLKKLKRIILRRVPLASNSKVLQSLKKKKVEVII